MAAGIAPAAIAWSPNRSRNERLGAAYAIPASSTDVLILKEIQEQLESLEKWFATKEKHSDSAQARLSASVAYVKAIPVPAHFDRLENMTWPNAN